MKGRRRDRYEFALPKFFTNQDVVFKDHRGRIREGHIGHVETNYSNKKGKGVHVAYHVYSIRIPGHERWLHVGEQSVLKIIGIKQVPA